MNRLCGCLCSEIHLANYITEEAGKPHFPGSKKHRATNQIVLVDALKMVKILFLHTAFIMFRIVKLRRFGARDERGALLRDPGLVGKIDIFFMPDAGGGQVKYLRLSVPKSLSSDSDVLGLLQAPDFLTFNGDVFLARGIETDDKGRQFVQEWWGRREPR